MTDDTAAPEPSSSPGGRWRIPALVAALVLVIVVVVAVATRGGDDETDPAADPTTSSAPTTAASSSPASDSPSDSPTANDDPIPSPIINEAVQAAMDDQFPAMVPAGVPAGWTVEKATYSAKRGGIWRIDLTDPTGADVQVVQSKKSVEGIVHEYLGQDAQAAGQVNLSDYGTGKWAVWTSASQTGVAREISDTAVLVVGPDQDTVVELAQALLTAEDAGMSGEG